MTASHTNSASYDVGYGKPPRRTQFQPGQSGNPCGRPPAQKSDRLQKLALHEAYRTVIVKEEGHAVPLSAIQAVLRSQIEAAAHGNVRAQCSILAMIWDAERAEGAKARLGALYEPVSDDDSEIYGYGDADDDIDDVVEDGGVVDDGGVAPALQADETGMDDDARQEESELSAAPPPSAESASAESASADGVPPPENAAAPPAAGVPVGAEAAEGAPASRNRGRLARPRKKSGRDARGPRSAAPPEPAASPGRHADGMPALRPLLRERPLSREEEKIENSLLNSLLSGNPWPDLEGHLEGLTPAVRPQTAQQP